MRFATESERRLLCALLAEEDPGVQRLIAGLLRLDGWEVRDVGSDEPLLEEGDPDRLSARARATFRWHAGNLRTDAPHPDPSSRAI